jgi:hypothetical protein
MKILVACEESQTVCKAFRARGHEAYSCDILPCSGGHPEWHLQMDALMAAWYCEWDLMIAHPPCTYISFAGMRWNVNNKERQAKTAEAIQFFKQLYDFPKIDKIAIENPVGVIPRHTGIKWDQMIHPWQFGHGEQKKTCLWLRNLPPLKPTKIVEGREQKMFKMAPSPDRAKLRSKTYPGIARAMAEQWG